MKEEYFPKETKSEQEGVEEQKNIADDLKFVRSAIENTYRQVRPDTHILIMWGVICLISYSTIHFLEAANLHKWAPFVGWFLVAIGLCYVFVTWRLINKREKKSGFISVLKQQLIWVWMIIMVLHGLIWSILSVTFNNYCVGDPGFLFAILFSIAMSITGIFASKKEGLYGGMLIYIGLLLAFFIKDYSYIIIGLATGAGLIIPAIIVQKNYRKQEKSYE